MESNKSNSSDEEDIFPGFNYDPNEGLQEDVASIGLKNKHALIEKLQELATKDEVVDIDQKKDVISRTSIADVESRIKQAKIQQEKQKKNKRRQQLRDLLKHTREINTEWQHDMCDKLEKKPKRDLDS